MVKPVVTSEKMIALGRETSAPMDARRQALERARGNVALALADLKQRGYGLERATALSSSRSGPVKLGNEEPNDDVYQHFARRVQWATEPIDYYLAFDFGQKIMALTASQVLVIPKNGVELALSYRNIASVPDPNHDREIVLENRRGTQYTYRVGDSSLARQVRGIIRSRTRSAEPSSDAAGDNPISSQNAPLPSQVQADNEESVGIAERVRFWEEQDRINRELIPRVVRQHELFVQHISEHENLPEVAGRAISEALNSAREAQQRRFDEALDAARAELGQQSYAKLQQALEQLQSVLGAAKTELSDQFATQQAQALVEMQNALAEHQAKLDEQYQSKLEQTLATLKAESRKTRNLIIGIAASAAAVSCVVAVATFVAK